MIARNLSLQIRPAWEELVKVRRDIVGFLKGLQVDQDAVDAMAMVGCELCENAIKYGTVLGPDDRIGLSVSLTATEATVEVANRIGEKDAANLLRLDQMVQWIRGFQDPFEAFLQRLRELSSQPPDSTESRLGLVRIAYEGQSVLDFYVDERDVLAVSAIRRLGSWAEVQNDRGDVRRRPADPAAVRDA